MSGRTKSKKKGKTKQNPLFQSKPRTFRIGQDVLPSGRDLGRYVKWPRYIRIQRQRKILMQRLKTPPAVNQFTNTLDKSHATDLFKLLAKIRPESKKDKKERLKATAAAQVEGGKSTSSKPPPTVKFGLKHVTTLVEEKKAKLVLIASDVDPLELVVWMPALCRKMDVPYCIVKNKGRLGAVVHQKKATCLAITDVEKEDQAKLQKLADLCKQQFNEDATAFKKWGGGIMGLRTQAKLEKRAAAIAAEEAKKAKMMM